MSAGADVDVTSGTSAPEFRTDWAALAREIGPGFAARAADFDETDTFVAENYAELKARRVFSAGVPAELGGGGASHPSCAPCCASWPAHCGSTALALSMHTHLLAATVWRWRQGQPVEPLLQRIAEEQLVLVSTGASDWLDSSGTGRRGRRAATASPHARSSAVAPPPATCWSPARSTTIPRTGRPCCTSPCPSPPKG